MRDVFMLLGRVVLLFARIKPSLVSFVSFVLAEGDAEDSSEDVLEPGCERDSSYSCG